MKASLSIADEIRERIVRGDLRAGDPLPPESDLAKDLGYSKPTVREALRILENEGLIEIKRGLRGGPQVRQLSIAEVARPIGVYLQLGDVAVLDVWASRDRIVAAAIERLASMPDVNLAPLGNQVDLLASHVGDVPSFPVHMITTSEVAVELAGSSTDHLVVVALRHVVEAQLAAATAASTSATDDIGFAVAAEEEIAGAWRTTYRHIRAGRGRAARAAFEEQALMLQSSLAGLVAGMTVGDTVRATPEQLASDHAARMAKLARPGERRRRRPVR